MPVVSSALRLVSGLDVLTYSVPSSNSKTPFSTTLALLVDCGRVANALEIHIKLKSAVNTNCFIFFLLILLFFMLLHLNVNRKYLIFSNATKIACRYCSDCSIAEKVNILQRKRRKMNVFIF